MRGASLLHRLADVSAQEPSCGYLWGVRVRRVFMPSRMRQGRSDDLRHSTAGAAKQASAIMLACGPKSRRSGVVRPQRPRLSGLFNTDYYIHWRATGLLCDGGIWDGARRARGAPGAAGGVSTAGAGTRQWVLGQARAGTMAWCWYVQGARGEGARRGQVLASARAGNINLRRRYTFAPRRAR